MNRYKFKITLTNGEVNIDYDIYASNEREATILAQAEAINEGKGYDFVCIERIENNY